MQSDTVSKRKQCSRNFVHPEKLARVSPMFEYLVGCASCDFNPYGCHRCSSHPRLRRPVARWKPEEGYYQDDIPTLEPFRPSEEEWKDPIKYLSNVVYPSAKEHGIAVIIPPLGWDPPFSFENGLHGLDLGTFEFDVRKQPTSYLCYRDATTTVNKQTKEDSDTNEMQNDSWTINTGIMGNGQQNAFGFSPLPRKENLKSFCSYADWAKMKHFSCPDPKGVGKPSGRKNMQAFPCQCPMEVIPSVEEIEAEFWRIVERNDTSQEVEALYGQDLDNGTCGSGFPLATWRRSLLQEYFRETYGPTDAPKVPVTLDSRNQYYADHPWNINNVSCTGNSLLSLLRDEGLVSGVMVPWLYIGSCLSGFCWHIEDHALNSINYLHLGSPKVWYGVPHYATEAFECAMQNALPHLFDATPSLLNQLVTMVSPKELRRRGVPVFRAIHEAGSFVVTMPNAMHAGLNTGFNVAEAVNLAIPEWLPHGSDIIEKYIRTGRSVSISHDQLLVSLALAAVRKAKNRKTKIDMADSEEFGLLLGAVEFRRRVEEYERSWKRAVTAFKEGGVDVVALLKSGCSDSSEVLGPTDRDCCHCGRDLWFGGIICGEKDSMACIEHAYLVMAEQDLPLSALSACFRYSPGSLRELCNELEQVYSSYLEYGNKRAKNLRETERSAAAVLQVKGGPLYKTCHITGDCL